MKNPSKEKPSTVASQNRLNKTQAPQKAVDTFDNTYYGQGKNTVEQAKQAPQQLPPRSGSSQKINYKVCDNMTNSKIQEAKKGLQLLKKKMSRNGMSREKNSSIQKKQEYVEQAVSKKAIQKPTYEEQQPQYLQKQIKKPLQKGYEKQQSNQQMNKKSPPIPTKIIDKSPPIGTKANMDDRPIKRNPPKQQFVNELQEVPIKANQDFFAILQRQMAKQNSKNGGVKPNKPAAKKQQMYQQQSENIQLIECSKGCERKFNQDAIEKHQRICEKVFLTKRKAFDAAAQRKLQEQGFKQPQQPPPPPSKAQKTKKQTVTEEKVPKWKLQSAAFRAGLKQGRGQQLTGEQKKLSEQANNMTQCPSCGRKFNADAAKRHIPICEAKSKQMPKMNTKKK